MDCSPPGSSVHGILQARILEWVAISFSKEFSRPRDQTCKCHVSCIAGGFFTHSATREALNKEYRMYLQEQGRRRSKVTKITVNLFKQPFPHMVTMWARMATYMYMTEVGSKFIFIRSSSERIQASLLGVHVRQSVPAFCLLLLWFVIRYLCCSQIYSHLQSVSFSVCIKCGPLEKHKMLEMDSVGNMRSQLYVMCA